MTEDGRLIAGRYQVGPLLGRGGMADVYRGTDSRLGRTVAIKILKVALAADPAFRMRFRQEAQAAARMSHPTIVRVFDAGEEVDTDADGAEVRRPYIVMEYVQGRLLKDIIAEGPLDVDEAVRVQEGILTALEYSHRAGVVHRDIKPGNVMLTESGQVKVMDFGIARAVSDSSATVAQTTAILGTAAYFSPEQAKGEQVDARTDLYSSGVVLFEMLTGRAPFRGDTPVAVAYQHVSEMPPAPSSINSKVSPAIDLVVSHALAKDRFERFQGAAEFREDLHLAAEGKLPSRKVADDFSSTLFGSRPGPLSDSELALRQLAEDGTMVRTQRRPPVVWIWASIVVLAVIVATLVIWVVNLSPSTQLPEGSREVPALTGVTYESATETLQVLELVPSRIDEYNSSIEKDHVIRTDPGEGTIGSPGVVVTVYVSLGARPVAVPDVVNKTTTDADADLVAAGLIMGAATSQNSATVPADVVISTDPAAGTQVGEGDTINLAVSSGNVALPDVVGQTFDVARATLTAAELQLVVTPQPGTACAAGQAANTVAAQSLPPGDVPQKSEVVLTYCTG